MIWYRPVAPELALVFDEPVETVMEPPLALVGMGEAIEEVAARLQEAPAVLVLDGGRPVGILTRSDLLSFMERG